MATTEVYPRRQLGAAEYWGRVVENRIENTDKLWKRTSQSVAGVDRSNDASQEDLAAQIEELSGIIDLLPASGSNSYYGTGFGLSPGWNEIASLSIPVPPGKSNIEVVARGNAKMYDGGGVVEGSFNWPFSLETVSSEYGPRSGGFHYGMDFAVPEGTSIPSPAAGTVASTGYDGSRGNYINVSHPGSIITRYFHLVVPTYLSAGDAVTAGQSLGFVGDTGASLGAHLHWETAVGGVTMNPRDFMATYGAGSSPGFAYTVARILINGVPSLQFDPYKVFGSTWSESFYYPLSGLSTTGSSLAVTTEIFADRDVPAHASNYSLLSVFGVFSS